ncbi:hypothetical protein BJ138DRAFT_1160233 [Hygrophoropsis aurantiaca]|uniref:Uncharacterized protein n=1 Tax=Hygrophoropsis aurantiaca TaxID=72124 RepID=A0ACB8A322_9AGAM|nr:hypothetical protein BJ138DRAFT_1160233 [Hygrophoropsis aurantiaca]
MIYPATGRPREWSNWRSIPIEIGDYGITNQKTGVFEVYGNIYSSAIRESLKKVDPGMDLDRYRPKVGDVEPDLIIYSKGVVSCPFETGVEATVHGLTNASFKHRWKFAKGNDGAVLVMRRPRQSKIPKEILGTLTTLPELAGKDIVSSTFSSPQYFIYSSRGAGEKLSLALIPKESPAHSGELMVNGTAALGLDWWTDAGPSAHIRKGCDEAGRYSFTPLCLMRHKAPPYSAFFRYEG